MTVRYSVSSAETFQTCQRRWWFDKVIKPDGALDDDRSALDFGSAVHLVLERHLQGLETPPGEYPGDRGDTVIVKPVHLERTAPHRDLLPVGGHGYRVEEWLPRVEIADGYVAVGKLDTWTTPSEAERTFLGAWPEGVVAHINDWKTTSVLGSKSPQNLREENQGALYAAILQKGGAIPEGPVLWSHGYVTKSGPPRWWRDNSNPFMSVILTPEEISAAWARNREWAQNHLPFINIRDIESQDDVPANRQGCNSYNRRCPFTPVCNIHKKRSVLVGLNALINKKKAQETTAATAAPTTAPSTTVQPRPAESVTRDPAETRADREKAHAKAVSGGDAAKAKEIESRATSLDEEGTLKNGRWEATGVQGRLPYPSKIAPPDQIPVRAELVQSEFLRECAALLISAEVPRFEAEDVLRDENLPSDYFMNVIEYVWNGTTALSAFSGDELMAGWPNTANALLGRTEERVSPTEAAALEGSTVTPDAPPWEGEDKRVISACEYIVAVGRVDEDVLRDAWKRAGGARLTEMRRNTILKLVARVGLHLPAAQDVVVAETPKPSAALLAAELAAAESDPAPSSDGGPTEDTYRDIASRAVAALTTPSTSIGVFDVPCTILSGVSVRYDGAAPFKHLRDWPVFGEVYDHVVGSLPKEGVMPLSIPELWSNYGDNFGKRFGKLFELRMADEALPGGMWAISKTDPLRQFVVDVLVRKGATVISADNA